MHSVDQIVEHLRFLAFLHFGGNAGERGRTAQETDRNVVLIRLALIRPAVAVFPQSQNRTEGDLGGAPPFHPDDIVLVEILRIKGLGVPAALQIVEAGGLARLFSRFIQRGQQHGRQNRNNCYYYEKFNKCKPLFHFFPSCWLKRLKSIRRIRPMSKPCNPRLHPECGNFHKDPHRSGWRAPLSRPAAGG